MSISRSALIFPVPASSEALSGKRDELEIVGSSAAMRRLRMQVRRIGPHFRTVLIRGEAGTGKELVARVLHGMSRSASGPFVACDPAAIEDALMCCEGGIGPTYTPGHLMMMSHRGTLFLDQINEMPLKVQSQLVRALRDHDWAQSQMEARQRVDLRMIASASEDLRVLVSMGRFRQELYQRLATVEITVPPLRERIEDLPELALHFLRRLALLHERGVPELTDEAMRRLRGYRWPGNVRELEGVLQSCVLQSGDRSIQAQHLPVFSEAGRARQSKASASQGVRLQEVVEQHVMQVLKDCGGNKVRAAEVLGISRSTLYRMLNDYTPIAPR